MAGGSEDVYVMVQTGRKIGTNFSGVRVGEEWQEEMEGQAEVYTVERRSFSSLSEKTAGLILSTRRQTADKIQHSAVFVPSQQFFI